MPARSSSTKPTAAISKPPPAAPACWRTLAGAVLTAAALVQGPLPNPSRSGVALLRNVCEWARRGQATTSTLPWFGPGIRDLLGQVICALIANTNASAESGWLVLRQGSDGSNSIFGQFNNTAGDTRDGTDDQEGVGGLFWLGPVGQLFVAVTTFRPRLLDKIDSPWDMAFLQDGTMFFTEKCKGLSVRMPTGTVKRCSGWRASRAMPPARRPVLRTARPA